MLIEKPKRKRRPKRQSWKNIVLILVMVIPLTFIALHPALGHSLLTDGIALSVMICAAVYLVYQAVLWLIASYMGILDEEIE